MQNCPGILITVGVATGKTVEKSSTHGPGRPNLTVLDIPDILDISDVAWLFFRTVLDPLSQLWRTVSTPP